MTRSNKQHLFPWGRSKGQNKIYLARLAKKLCGVCGIRPHLQKLVLCRECRKRQRSAGQKYRRKYFFHARAKIVSIKYGVKITAKDLASLWHQQRGYCFLTGDKLTIENAEVDHKLSPLLGGQTISQNLRWVTREANRCKQKLTDEEFYLFCKKIIAFFDKRKDW